jgi:hypothetical protein
MWSPAHAIHLRRAPIDRVRTFASFNAHSVVVHVRGTELILRCCGSSLRRRGALILGLGLATRGLDECLELL